MSDLVSIGVPPSKPTTGWAKPGARRPEWLRVKVRDTHTYRDVRALLRDLKLTTVCEEARCPNIWECWGQHRTATFMILGEVCTRACRYCSVATGRSGDPVDPEEPAHVAEAVVRLGLSHAVVTSVDRDDLADFGAGHFVDTLAAIHKAKPDCRVEVLIPDFGGDRKALETVLDARPDILDHNTETVPRLYRRLRPKGSYLRALDLLRWSDEYRRDRGASLTTKTGVILGLGETQDEVLAVMDDLREAHCDVLTLGQYLNPTATKKHVAIEKFYTPDEFAWFREQALQRGFKHCESGPLVRSSYHAHEHVPR